MNLRNRSVSVVLSAVAMACAFGALTSNAFAGGPLLTRNTSPVRWTRSAASGGNLNSQTVDALGRVLYHVDSGPLGPLSNAEAVKIVDRIFNLYTDVPTASIEFVNAGPILDPNTGSPVDVNGSNAGRFLGNNSTFQNPIIFDSDGQITGGGGVLGFFTFLRFNGSGELVEGTVVLNGSAVNSVGGAVPFAGVFTHEFGHFAGPLDHAQSNGNIAANGQGSTIPPGFNTASAFDLYAPFTETLYPFFFRAPFGSQLAGNGFNSSGFFVASLDMDTQNALSAIYPEPGFRATDPGSPNGAIAGSVIIRTASGDIPITGVNVVARRISQGAYPPPPGTTAYPGNNVTTDADGFPLPPPVRAATDPLVTVESVVTGVAQPAGAFLLDGLPPGDYLVEIQQLNPRALGGSGIGPLGTQIPLPEEEFYNGDDESGDDDPTAFVPVTVRAGEVTGNIDILLNGFPTTALSMAAEAEPNEKPKKAQMLALPIEVMGRAASTDPFKVQMDFGSQGTGPVQDLYKITLNKTATVFISLDSTSGSGDLDLYLLRKGFPKKNIPIDDASVIDFSASPNSNEFVAVEISAGTYFLAVSAFDGNQSYLLRAFVTN